MSRTIRKSLDRKSRRNSKRELRVVPDGKCSYRCKCSYCVKTRRRFLEDSFHLNEIKNIFVEKLAS